MIQQFIELGEGRADVYELVSLIETKKDAAEHLLRLETEKSGRRVVSYILVCAPAGGKFQPLYVCLEGIPHPEDQANERSRMIEAAAEKHHVPLASFAVKPSSEFYERDLFYQHLIGVLRMNLLIPRWQ
ncbi:hypothetical protein B0H94_10268 [Salsuginibacillus halophilus]|uniref:DUF7147 domain-containing protein n=1 Tax=Salsuginibacillus halophilus TaxID=517424 RepID=A0A2P8HX51_9BACI|nr:methylthioribose kinase [Salsuginibacillus halophilus]PSL50792.1 hypothetical protein B0H94_10268 [Salsuginibacillus halophilus]